MSEAPVGVTRSTDRRALPYLVLAFFGLVGTLVTTNIAFGAVAVPVAIRLLSGLASKPIGVTVSSVALIDECVEGDELRARLHLRWSGVASVEVAIETSDHLAPVDDLGERVEADGEATVDVRLDTVRWGRATIDRVVVRATRPGSMIEESAVLLVDAPVRVMPRASRLDQLLRPRRPRSISGAHLSPDRGPGTDFGDLRPYQPGDRLRDVAWAPSARGDELWVINHHPERTGTVVIIIDTIVDGEMATPGIVRAGRIAWSIANHHLAAGDRVGIASLGARPTWLPPTGGRRAMLSVIDAVLDIGDPPRTPVRAPTAPAEAAVIGISTLASDAFLAALGGFRRSGRSVQVLGVDIDDLLPATDDPIEIAARRLWQIDAKERQSRLAAVGIATAMVRDDPQAAIAGLSRRAKRSAVTR